jgi:hypothetical protein
MIDDQVHAGISQNVGYDLCPPAASKSLRDFDAAQGIDKWKKEYL